MIRLYRRIRRAIKQIRAPMPCKPLETWQMNQLLNCTDYRWRMRFSRTQ